MAFRSASSTSFDSVRMQATAAGDPQEVEHQIRQRAYELYEEGGRQDGHELDNWLRAKEEITEKKARSASASRF